MSRPPSDPRRRAGLAAALALACAAWGRPLAAQTAMRPLPETAEAGRLRIGVFPEATLDGRPIVLGPGTRIYDAENRIVPPGQVDGERKVAFVRGQIGEVLQVWLLSDAEFRDLTARIAAARRAAQQR